MVLVATIRGGVVRTVYVDLPVEVPRETLLTLTVALNERLAGLTLSEIRTTLPDRLRDAHSGETGASELLNIFVQSGAELFSLQDLDATRIHLGRASVLAAQPEFESGERLKGLIGPTRMPYEKVVSIVDYTSTLVTHILET